MTGTLNMNSFEYDDIIYALYTEVFWRVNKNDIKNVR